MTEMVYYYDGSFEGFLCCIFDSYANKEVLTAIYRDEDLVPTLFASRSIPTDRDHASRVYRKIVKCSPYTADLLRKGFLTCLPDKELYLYRLVVKLLREGPGFLRNFSDETLYPVLRAVRHLNGEAHLLKGFVRFSDLGGVLGGEIEPKNRVLPLLRSHFAPATRAKNFSSMTALTGKPCSTPTARRSSSRWSIFRWRRRMKQRPITACFGSGFTTPLPLKSGTTPNAARPICRSAIGTP